MTSNGEAKCSCETHDSDSESLPRETKKSKISLSSLSLNLRRGRSLPLKSKRSKKSSAPNLCCDTGGAATSSEVQSAGGSNAGKKSTKWPLKFYCGKKESRTSPVRDEKQNGCKCTCYRRASQEIQPEEREEQQLIQQQEEEEEQQPIETSTVSPSSSSNTSSTSSTANEEADAPMPAESTDEPPAQQAEEDAVNEENVPEPPAVIFNTIDRSTYAESLRIPDGDHSENINRLAHIFVPNFMDLQWRPMGQEDVDEEARIQRAREIERGVEAPPSFRPARRVQLFCSDESESQAVGRLQIFCRNDVTVDSLRAIFQNNVTIRTCPLDVITGCHTQIDFIHCLVPDLLNITNCSFYWGKMDRYEAERLLDGKREGTFLLRDSAQEEFLFSVSFRKYGRSLHARIEQWNHKFSFDSHDPGVYTSNTVCGLIEHYKDPSSCMFFEPMLTWPLHRNFVFSLQHLCRATIVSRLTYDDVNHLQLPKSLKTYLKEYHYRQKVRVERFDDDVQWLEVRNAPS